MSIIVKPCFASQHAGLEITREIPMNVVSIVDSVAAAVPGAGWEQLLLLGTELTMESEAIRQRFSEHNVAAVPPERCERSRITALIDALQRGEAKNADHEITRLARKGAVLLGCTELALAFPERMKTPVFTYENVTYFNSLAIHVPQYSRPRPDNAIDG